MGLIKPIDDVYTDLVCDLIVSQPATMAAGASVSDGQNWRRYMVHAVDTRFWISCQFYGDANQYRKIFGASRSVLRDPATIGPGQELAIPDRMPTGAPQLRDRA